jgi:hypothetical protein
LGERGVQTSVVPRRAEKDPEEAALALAAVRAPRQHEDPPTENDEEKAEGSGT